MQNFNTYWIDAIRRDGRIRLPVGNAKGSFIDARDIAAVAASLLTRKDLAAGSSISLAWKRLTMMRLQAHLQGNRPRHPLRGNHAEAMEAGLIAAGLPADYAAFMIMILGFFKAGMPPRSRPRSRKSLAANPAPSPTMRRTTGKHGLSDRSVAASQRRPAGLLDGGFALPLASDLRRDCRCREILTEGRRQEGPRMGVLDDIAGELEAIRSQSLWKVDARSLARKVPGSRWPAAQGSQFLRQQLSRPR